MKKQVLFILIIAILTLSSCKNEFFGESNTKGVDQKSNCNLKELQNSISRLLNLSLSNYKIIEKACNLKNISYTGAFRSGIRSNVMTHYFAKLNIDGHILDIFSYNEEYSNVCLKSYDNYSDTYLEYVKNKTCSELFSNQDNSQICSGSCGRAYYSHPSFIRNKGPLIFDDTNLRRSICANRYFESYDQNKHIFTINIEGGQGGTSIEKGQFDCNFNSLNQDLKIYNESEVSNDINHCQMIKSDYLKNECITKLALKQFKPEYCNKINEENAHIQCKELFIDKLDDNFVNEFCNNLTSQEYKIPCYFYLAKRKHDINYCKNFSGMNRDGCICFAFDCYNNSPEYDWITMENNSHKCDLFVDETLRYNCRRANEVFNANLSFCFLEKSNSTKDACIRGMMYNHKNISLDTCDLLSTNEGQCRYMFYENRVANKENNASIIVGKGNFDNISCKTLGTQFVENSGFYFVGCDMELIGNSADFDLSKSYCTSTKSNLSGFLQNDLYHRYNYYFVTLTGLPSNDTVRVYAWSKALNSTVECLPPLTNS